MNLRHLKFGTRRENIQDRFRLHGDTNAGERNPRHRLTEVDVRAIRLSAETDAALASRYGVSPATVNFARNRVTWKHIA